MLMSANLAADTCRTRAALESGGASLRCPGLNGAILPERSPQTHHLHAGTRAELNQEAPHQPRTSPALAKPLEAPTQAFLGEQRPQRTAVDTSTPSCWKMEGPL